MEPSAESSHPGSNPNPPRIPDELMQRLHEAAVTFHDARAALEKAMDGFEYRHQERVNRASGHVKDAEKELEDVASEISRVLPPSADDDKGRAPRGQD